MASTLTCPRMDLLLPSIIRVVMVSFLLHPPAKGAFVRVVFNHNRVSQDFDARPSQFGPALGDGLVGQVVEAKPANACQPIEGPPVTNESAAAFVALIRRYDCPFVTKVLHAQGAGYHAVLVHNVDSQTLVTMLSDKEELGSRVAIPSMFISDSASTQLRRIFHYDPAAHIILVPRCQSLSCWDGGLACQGPAAKSGPKGPASCLTAPCPFFASLPYLLIGLTLVIWTLALYVVYCL